MLYILIPYKNETAQMFKWTDLIISVEEIRSDIIIVFIEQGNDKPYNNGLLINAAFRSIIKEPSDTVIIQNINIVPSAFLLINTYTSITLHDNKIYEIFDYHNHIKNFKLLARNFIQINGFATNFWGEGFHEIYLIKRIEQSKLNLICNHNDLDNYNINYANLKHEISLLLKNEQNPNKLQVLLYDISDNKKKIKYIKKNGLNTTHFKLLRHVIVKGHQNIQLMTFNI